MTKLEMINAVNEMTPIAKKDITTVVDCVLETIAETLKAGEKVAIHGFGSFEPKTRTERNGHNPKTLEKLVIPASKTVTFKPATALKNSLN